jgi:hypothetical protein
MDAMEKLDRLVEVTAALLEGAPSHRLQITNLNKALFYLDLVALKETGETITGADYVALPQGPAVDGYKKTLIPALENMGVAEQDRDGMGKPVVLKRPPKSYHYLDDHLRARAAEVSAFVARKTAAQISDLSHGNPGWKIAFDKGQGQQKKAERINMMVAMQQIVEHDPWLDEKPDARLRESLEHAEHQMGEDL